MATANEFVVDILEEIVVQQDEAPIEASEAQAVIRFMNDRATAWAADGINLGYTLITKLSDTVTIPAGAFMGFKAQVAIDIAPKYEVSVKPETIARANEGMNAILALTVDTAEMEFSGNLPQGSGNTYPGYLDNTFYEDRQNTILTETGGSIALEEDTEEA